MNSKQVKKILQNEGVFVFKATGYSMRPLIPYGSLVSVKPINRKPFIGDVLLVIDNQNKWLCHRCIKRNGSQITTKGDANPCADSPVDVKYVVGIVVEVITPWQSIRRFDTKAMKTFGFAYAILQRLAPSLSPHFAGALKLCIEFASKVKHALPESLISA